MKSDFVRSTKVLRQRVMSGASAEPADFVLQRKQVAALRTELKQRCRPVLVSWVAALRSVQAAGLLMEENGAGSGSIQQLGVCVAHGVAGVAAIEALREAVGSVDKKMEMLSAVEHKCRELEALALSRDRYKRKKEDAAARMVRKGVPFSSDDVKFSREFEDSFWDHEELYCEISADFSFFLGEAQRRGPAAAEMDFLEALIIGRFKLDCRESQSKSEGPITVSPATSLQDFMLRRTMYVSSSKTEQLKAKLQQEGVIRAPAELMPVVHSSSSSPTSNAKLCRTFGCEVQCEPVDMAAGAQLPPSATQSPTRSPSRPMQLPSAMQPHSRPPAPLPPASGEEDGDLSVGEDRDVSVGDDGSGEDGDHSADDGSASDSGASTDADSRTRRPSEQEQEQEQESVKAEAADEIEQALAQGFLIAEREGWMEMVDRVSGDSFWVHPASKRIVRGGDGPHEHEEDVL